jgi:pimeloyl-ACP methyl ester carboxylesterase
MAAIVEKITVRRLSLQERERLVADMLAASREAWEAWLNHGSREDISASVERIAIPMAVVAGGGDQTIPVAVLRRELLRSSPTATMEIVADAGHLLPLEAGDQVAAIIRSSTRERANSTKEGAGCTA